MKSLCGEPVCLWLPDSFRPENASFYVQGVEVSTDYDGPVPEGFDVITLPVCQYLMFQGEPFEEENYCHAIEAVQESIKKYNPASIGLRWNMESPRIQLEPIGTRGYIELLPVKPAN